MAEVKLSNEEMDVLRMVWKKQPFQMPLEAAKSLTPSDFEQIIEVLLNKDVLCLITGGEEAGIWVTRLGKDILGVR